MEFRLARIAITLLVCALLPSSSFAQSAGRWTPLVEVAPGRFLPAAGYVWDGDPRTNNLAAKVRPDLRIHSYDANGAPSFVPAPGYEWNGNPATDNLAVRVRRDLRVHQFDADGVAVSFLPGPGYVWAGNPNTLVTKVRHDLRIHHHFDSGYASFVPAPGYVWVGNPNDLVTRVRDDLRVIHVSPEGLTTFVAAGGYEFAGNPNNLVTRVRNGLAIQSDGRFLPAPGLEWMFPHDPNNFDVRTRSDLRVYSRTADGTPIFVPAPGYEWIGNKDHLTVAKSCADISGVWNAAENDLTPMVISQSGCWFRARFWNRDGTILHEIHGTEGRRMTVVRYAPGCTTEMYGRVFLGDSGLWWTIDGTQGACGIDGHSETRLFQRSGAHERLRWALNQHPNVDFDRDPEVHEPMQRSEPNRGPAMDLESARMLKDVAMRAGRIAVGAIVGGNAGKRIAGGPWGAIIGGLLVPQPTAGPDRDIRGPSGNGGGGGAPNITEGGLKGGPGSTMSR